MHAETLREVAARNYRLQDIQLFNTNSLFDIAWDDSDFAR